MKIDFLVVPLFVVFFNIFTSIENNSLSGQCNSESGTLTGISNFIGESTRRDLNDTIFLCWRDRFYLQHNGDYNVSGDPNPSTPGGVGYGWYTDRPVATGNTLNTIRTTDDIFRLNDDMLNWKISVGELNGNTMFENSYFSGSQSFNSYVNNGLPTAMYYAPVTIDYRIGKRGYHEFGGGVKGPCVKASPDESFMIVYLNPIEIFNIEHYESGDSIEVSFWVSGGSPEYYDRFGQLVEYQSIEIIDFYSHKVVKTLPVNGVTHNSRVVFKVKNRSTFEIVITDRYGCNESNLLVLTETTNPVLKLDTINLKVGETGCLKFDALNFDNPLYALGRIDYDPTVIDFHSIEPSTFSGFFKDETDGLLVVDFPIPGTAWPDNLFLCFTAVGRVGDCSPVNLTYFELINSDIEEFLPHTQHGLVCVDAPDGLYVSTRFCGSESLFSPEANITFQVHNGIAPYVYEVRQVMPLLPNPVVTGIVFNPNIEIDVFGLYAGRRYTITVTDNNGTGSTFTTPEIFISTTPPLEFESVDIQNPTCYGFRDGSIAIDVKDGQFFPYSLRWSTNVFNLDTLRYLASGNYGVTITDRTTGCRTDTLVNLFVPRLNVEWEILDDASCSGVNDGVAIARVSGGTPDLSAGYTYKWKNIGQPEFVDTDFSESTYFSAASGRLTLVYHDRYRYCNDTAFIDIGTKYLMSASEPVINNPNCNGSGDGTVNITPELIGYSDPEYALRYITWPPYPYERIGDEFILTNLDGRRYIIELEETNTGCSVRDTIDLVEPAPINAWVSNVTNTGCLPGQTARATVTVLNGVVPITLTGIGPDIILSGTSHTFTGLETGDYKVFIEDANGCTDSVEFTVIMAPGLLRIDSINYEPLGCSLDATTDIVVYASTSHGAITYRWSDLDGNPLGANSNTLLGIGAGTYIVELEDLFPCVISDTIIIIQSSPFDYTTTTSPSECGSGETGGILGEACITIDGDDSGFSFAWSNGMIGQCVTGLFAGEYTVTISDGLGCDIVESVTVDGGPAIVTEILALMGVSCFEGTSDGAVAVLATGGSNPLGQYTFSINGGITQLGNVVSFGNLQGGPNTLSVSYNTVLGNVCTKTEVVDVPVPERLVLDMINSVVNRPTCYDDCDGSALIQASGGNNANYFYSWLHSGQEGAIVSGLCAGTYSIQITDANLCTVTESIDITQPDELVVAIGSNTRDINCFGGNTGEIHIDYSGGNTDGPYSFDWSPDVSESAIAVNLAAGAYSVTVTDYKGCSNFITYELSEQAPVIFEPVQDGDIRCYGEQTCITVENVSGGSGLSYTFSINGGAIFPIDDCRNVFASELPYLVTVFDSDGCRSDREILITQPEKIEVDLGDRLVIDLGETGVVSLVTNAVIADVEWDINTLYNTYEFLNSQQSEIQIGSTADNVIYANVTDVNGCTATGELQIIVNTVRNVYVPNVFTPDGDGINDIFRIKTGKGVDRVNYIRVFDRWGERIYNEENVNPASGYAGNWNGTFKGQKLNPGVYVYTIEVLFNDKREIVYRGSITLLR